MVWELVAYQWTLHKESLWLTEVWLLFPVENSVLGVYVVLWILKWIVGLLHSPLFHPASQLERKLSCSDWSTVSHRSHLVWFSPNGLYLHHWNVLPAYISSLLSHFKINGSWVDASTCYEISSKGLHTTRLWLFTCSYVFFSLNNLVLYNTRNSFLAFSCAISLIWSVYCFSGGVIFI